MHAVERHGLVTKASVVLRAGAGRRHAAAVKGKRFALLCVVDHRKRIATEAALHRKHDAFRGGDRNCRIKRIAPALKDAKADESSDRVSRAHHAACSEGFGPPLDACGFRRT